MDDLLAMFGLGRAITLASALIVSVGALVTPPAAQPPPATARLAVAEPAPLPGPRPTVRGARRPVPREASRK
jgi:hypothetical protein